MLRGMTGYALEADDQTTVEIHSVNKRHLEIRLNGPRKLEPAIRKQIREKISRGQITITVQSNRSLKEKLDQIAQELELDRKDCVDLLPLYEETFDESVYPLVERALHQLLAMREEEGASIERDLHLRIETIERWIGKIDSLDVTEKLKQRLQEKLEGISDERIAQEVVMLAERADITEEIVRLRHHLKQMLTYTSGKTLEFVTQEMLRETNTIGAKAQDTRVTDAVIAIKSELEKIREQLANVE